MSKGKVTTLILFLMLIAGLSLLLYPSFSNYWNSVHATQAIARYSEELDSLDDERLEALWQEAIDYNQALYESGVSYTLPGDLAEKYEDMLSVGLTGVMGYIEIESLGVFLPIYHGTSDGVLQVAVGHVDWSSLPVGGASTHSVLSGHRGLPSAKLFTDLDDLREGDTFSVTVLNMQLTYEVDQIRIVEPENADSLNIVGGKDYCTLVTCTPYGINTHRLLVRGHRIESAYTGNVRVISEAVIMEPLIVAPIVAIPILLLIMLLILTRKPKPKAKQHSFEIDRGASL